MNAVIIHKQVHATLLQEPYELNTTKTCRVFPPRKKCVCTTLLNIKESFSLVSGHFSANKMPLKHYVCYFFLYRLWKVHKIKNALKMVVSQRRERVHMLNKH